MLLFVTLSGFGQTVFISQYIETNSGTTPKGIEIYNPTGSDIVFSAGNALQVYQGTNGAACAALPGTLVTSGTLRAGEVWVIGTADLTAFATTNGTNLSGITTYVFSFNGDDALQLWLGGTLVDVFGTCGTDPGTAWSGSGVSTLDQNIQTIAGVCTGTTTYWSNPSLRFEWVAIGTTMTGFGNAPAGCSTPVLSLAPNTLSGFSYIFGSGPSVSQSYNLSGNNLTPAAGNITVTAPANYEVSLNNIAFSASVNVAYAASTLAATPIYVRLKSGLSVGPYNGQLISNAGGGATTVNVTCNGDVFGPLLSASVASMSGFWYVLGSGPSPSQSFTISGTYLLPAAGNITVNAPLNYEISLDNSTFSSSLLLPYAANTLANTTVYVRLISGLALGNYTGNIGISGGTATALSIPLDGDVISAPTPFEKGDFAILAVNSNISCLGAPYIAGDDEISFMTFRDIVNGDSFIMTDNGWERENPGEWGNSEGTIQVTRTGGSIPAGTIITFRMRNGGTYLSISPDANWSFTNLGFAGTSLVLNSGGDQIYFMQGGVWDPGTSSGTHDATYTPGVFLYAFNTNNSWTPFVNNTQNSGLIIGMECFNMMPGAATDYIEYTGPTTPATKRDWMNRLNNPLNWINRVDCATFIANNIHFGQTYTINAGGYSEGIWTGEISIDWFDCQNWQNLEVPDQTVNVLIPSAGVTFDPTIGNPPLVPIAYTSAESNTIEIQTGRTLTLDHANSRLDVYGDIINDWFLLCTNGLVNIFDDNNSITGGGLSYFYNLTINKTTNANTFSLGHTFNVAGVLTFTSGKIITGANRVEVSNPSTAAITGHNVDRYIIGNVLRYVSATGTYDFPVGTAGYYELATIQLNSSSGLDYIDAFFTAPHSTAIDITPLGLYISGSLLEELLNYGFWTLTPNAGTYNYNIAITSRGHTNQGSTAASHAVIKRPTSAFPWVSEGTHNNADQTMGAGWVRAVRNSLTVFSDFAIAKSNSGSLPVELISFDATLFENDVLLDWKTVSETNNDHFEIERSLDGEKDYEHIASISGNGNSNTELNYSFTDQMVPEGIIYYRLKQVDFDGKWQYAGIRAIVNLPNHDELILANQIIENNSVSFDLLNISGNYIIVEMHDITGRILYSKQFATNEASYRIRIVNENPSGIYFITVRDAQSTVTEKFLWQ